MSKTFSEEIDSILNAHAQEFKAGHLEKITDKILTAYKASGKRVIGETAEVISDDPNIYIPSDAQDRLRTEQSTRLAHEAGDRTN